MIPSANDLVAGAVVAALFLSIVTGTEVWRRLGSPKAEWTRKLIHIAGGLVALFLPLVIQSPLVVLTLALGMAGLFLVGKLTGTLKSLHGVERKSSGTEYYPLVIFLLFYLTQGEPWKYFICVLVLATADALAALVGSRYGRLRYEVDDNFKSLEGSMVFLVVTLLAVLVPLLTWPRADMPSIAACMLTAVLVALLTTAFEAVAQHGRDNLWVPLGTLMILNHTLPLPVEQLVVRVVVLLVMATIVGLVAWRTTTFNVGGTLVLILAAYISWALTSIDWAFPIFFAMAFYVSAVYLNPAQTMIASKAVVKAFALPFFVIVAASFMKSFQAVDEYRALFGPFLAACVTIVAQALWDEFLLYRKPRLGATWWGPILATIVTSAVVVIPSYAIQSDVSWVSPLYVAIVATLVGLPASMLIVRETTTESNRAWWIARILAIASAMALVALMQAASLSPPWNPR